MTKIHPACLSTTLDDLSALAVKMIKGEDGDLLRNELRRILREKAKNGSAPLTKSEYRYAEPFLWSRLTEIRSHRSPQFYELLKEWCESLPEAPTVTEDEAHPEAGAEPVSNDNSKAPNESARAVAERLKRLDEEMREQHRRLVEGLPEAALDDVARRLASELLAELEHLPFPYTGIAPLPFRSEYARLLGDSFELSSATRVLRPTREMLGSFERMRFPSPVSDRQVDWPVDDLAKDRFYFAAEVSGYKSAAPRASDALLVDVSDLLKTFVGLCLACNILEFAGPAEHEEVIMVAEANATGCDAVFLPEDEAAVYGGLSVPPLTEGLLALAKRNLHAISTAFRTDDKKVLSAGRWFFGSFCGSNELLKLVQATITLEILLGDETDQSSEETKPRLDEKPGTTELLASRCSYLIATSREERKTVRKQFKRVYHARSKAVHAGADLLRDDTDQLSEALILCRRVIQKELAVLTPVS